MKKGFAALIAIFVIYCLYWATGRSVMIDRLTASFDDLEARGYAVDHVGLSAGGFPFSFRSSLTDPQIQSPSSEPKPWSIKADHLTLQSRALTPLHWRAMHHGEARIDFRGPNRKRWLFDVQPLSVDIDTHAKLSGKLKSINASILRPKLKAVIGTRPPIMGLEDGQIKIKAEGQNLVFSISMTNIMLDPDTLPKWQRAFGSKLDKIDLTFTAEGLTSFSQTERKKWAQAGRLKGQSWTLNWNNNIFKGDFDITLSPSGANGTLRAEAEGLPGLISQIGHAGVVSKEQATALTLAGNLLPQSQTGTHEMSLKIRNGNILLFGQKIFSFSQ